MMVRIVRSFLLIVWVCLGIVGCGKKEPKGVISKSPNALIRGLYGDLDRVIHQPIRTKIMAYLVHSGPCDFTTIKELFDLNDGHMTTHMRELVGSGYVEAEKMYEDNRPKTIYHVTGVGRREYESYVQQMKNIL